MNTEQSEKLAALGYDPDIHKLINDNRPELGFVAKNQIADPIEFPLTNIAIVGGDTTKVGDIWWVPKNQSIVISGDIGLEAATLMVMAEKVVDADKAVDDERFLAVIDAAGKLSVSAVFENTGNYLISAERLNRGLKRIDKNIALVFPPIELDVYA